MKVNSDIVNKTVYVLIIVISLLTFWQFKPSELEECTITLKWYKSYNGETWAKVRTGMLWSFSYMGAMLPKDSFDKALTFSDSCQFTLNMHELGFNAAALKALSVICDSIKKTTEYQKNGSIDLSRFFVISLYSPYNYYKITNAEKDYDSYRANYPLSGSQVFGVTKSAVSKGNRLIRFGADSALLSLGMVAEEGYGSLIKKTFTPVKFETIAIMSNGQFRYAVYDKAGKLSDAANPEISSAGKPAKCMWCHEIVIQPLFSPNLAVAGMMTNDEFKLKVEEIQLRLNNYRKTLSTEIDFTKRQDHTQSELLYIGFMEPSDYRLKQEFGEDSVGLKQALKLRTHTYNEFPFLGNLYIRKKIDKLFAYPRIPVPDFVREKSNMEPDYFRH